MSVHRLALLGMIFLGGACTTEPTYEVSRRAVQDADAVLPVPEPAPQTPASIGTLRSRHHTVRIYAGLRYTVEDAEGRTLTTLATDAELRRQLPQLSRDLHHMLAHGELWAGL